jgi:hypothetical protein
VAAIGPVPERTLGPDRAALFMAADAYPALIRALHDAERAGFDLPRLLSHTVPRRGFADADDPSAVLTWRLRERLQESAEAQQNNRPRPLAALTLSQLHTLTELAAAHRAVAREALKTADAAFTHLPAEVTTRAGHTHPAWDQRPMGDLSRRELAAQLATVRSQIRRAQASRTELSAAARHVIADLTRETQLRRTMNWRDAAREDFQRERATSSAALGATSPAAIRRTLQTRRTTTDQRRNAARGSGPRRRRRRRRQDLRRAASARAPARPAPGLRPAPCFCPRVSGRFRAALQPVITAGSATGPLSSRPTKPRSAIAPSPAARRLAVSWSPGTRPVPPSTDSGGGASGVGGDRGGRAPVHVRVRRRGARRVRHSGSGPTRPYASSRCGGSGSSCPQRLTPKRHALSQFV